MHPKLQHQLALAQQVELTREKFKVDLAFMLMNSFSTSADTLAYLAKYPKTTALKYAGGAGRPFASALALRAWSMRSVSAT